MSRGNGNEGRQGERERQCIPHRLHPRSASVVRLAGLRAANGDGNIPSRPLRLPKLKTQWQKWRGFVCLPLRGQHGLG